MLMWLREERPCWYELGWRRERNYFPVFRIHPLVLEKVEFRKAPIIFSLSHKFNLGEFATGEEQAFGFGSFCTRTVGVDGLIEIAINLPCLRKPRICSMCRGTRKDPLEPEDDCRYCCGTGREYLIDRKVSLQVSATVSVITALLATPTETDCSKRQIMIVKTATASENSPIGGEIGPTLARWLGSRPDIPSIATGFMRDAWKKMMGEEDPNRFLANVNQDGKIHLSCPGQACGINPEYYALNKGGYEFSPHNVDSPAQQLTLLTALAAIHSEARRDGI